MYKRDIWSLLEHDVDVDEVLSGIEDVVIPLLQLNHSIERMMEALASSPATEAILLGPSISLTTPSKGRQRPQYEDVGRVTA